MRIRKRRANRGPDPHYLMNFLENFSRSAKLMHSTLREFRSKDNLIQEAIRQYIIGMTTCLETFYRDLYVALLEADEALFKLLFDGDKRGARLARMQAIEPDKISLRELAAELVKFQNLSGIDHALSEVLRPVGYVAALTACSFRCSLPARPAVNEFRLWPDWQRAFSSIFDQRHEFVHDANRACTVQHREIAELETVALIVPQLTTFLVADQLGPVAPLLISNHSVPAILLIDDVIAEDWELASDGDDNQPTQAPDT